MKVVHICASDTGGAANAAIRLHHGLIQAGVNSIFLSKFGRNKNIRNHVSVIKHKSFKHYINYGLEHFLLKNIFPPEKGYSEDTVLFTSPHSLFHPETFDIIRQADLVHLHWISHFVDYVSFFNKINKPVVWTLHDMNPFTAGCHYSGSCMKFTEKCIHCPQLIHTNQPEIASSYFDYKYSGLNKFKNLTIVSPSKWLMELSMQSKILGNYPHHQILYGFDTNVFKPLNRADCRTNWNIPADRINLLFVAHSLKMKMKGFELLLEALKLIPKEHLHLTIAGKHTADINLEGLSHTFTGHVSNEKQMAEIYNSADLYITPSLRDNLPNTVAEALLCGTPVLGFKIGGIQEMIINGKNGIFSSEISVQGLAEGIKTYLQNPGLFNRKSIHQEAQLIYNLQECSIKYIGLYQTILSGSSSS